MKTGQDKIIKKVYVIVYVKSAVNEKVNQIKKEDKTKNQSKPRTHGKQTAASRTALGKLV